MTQFSCAIKYCHRYQQILRVHPLFLFILRSFHYPTICLNRLRISGFHLYQAFILQLDESFSLPIPMMTLLTSGKLAAGKQNLIKEVLILPQPGTPMQKVSCINMLLLFLLSSSLSLLLLLFVFCLAVSDLEIIALFLQVSLKKLEFPNCHYSQCILLRTIKSELREFC